MKITPADLHEIQALIKPLDTPEIRAKYLAGDFPRANLVKDLNKRFRWDLLWSVDRAALSLWTARVYDYLNDSHIDTALRSIVPALTTKDTP